MSPKSSTTATTKQTKKAPETDSKPGNQSLIWRKAKHAFVAQKDTPSESAESDPRVQELLGLYGALEARDPKVQRLPVSQSSEKTVNMPALKANPQVQKMADISIDSKATVAKFKEEYMSQSYVSLGADYEEKSQGGEETSEGEDG